MTFLRSQDWLELRGVSPELVAVVVLAAESWREHGPGTVFRVTDGVRSYEEQTVLYREGSSLTLSSKHLDGRAVDLAILTADRKQAVWDFAQYKALNVHMQAAAKMLAVRVQWGGEWIKLRDGPHWELLDASEPSVLR